MDVVMHVFDVDSLDDLENELSILKRIRYKELLFCINKIDSVDSQQELDVKIANLKDAIKAMNLLMYHDSVVLGEPGINIFAVSSMKGLLLYK